VEQIYSQEHPELAAGKGIEPQVRDESGSALKVNDVN
jgi:hypothetical protein